MDSNFWASRLAAAKRQFTMQHNHLQTSPLDRLIIDDLEIEEEMTADVSCPYCYEEFDVVSLCSHLEDDHSYESKVVTVCPICSVKVSTDLLSHITLQHGQLFKLQRHQRLRKLLAMPNSQALSFLGRDLREAHLQALLEGAAGGGGGGGFRLSSNNSTSSNAAAVDPLLSSFFLNFPALPESEEKTKSLLLSKAHEENPPEIEKKLPNIWKTRIDSSPLSMEEREKRNRQAAGRAGFLQDLLVSTLMNSD
ncbi:protein DEHYDRATION-INDUCED 19-like [Impatiens glandulifera]|uniref:protein DEHYDRATION-INDUCED 19-like n=1 Tax=Impatiens glandulifera TaxID=253017 RepID=UPI001FB0AEA1|nr:protein DEHYDRATION-INDUCED 19-like [Impatiens glandulifera]